MIQLGLMRIGRLLKDAPIPWRAVHVAGTNGKGSVCSYISTMLSASGIKVGRFTSPHLIDRWDCIAINDDIVDQGLFLEIEKAMRARNKDDAIEASEFELLTATAFAIFSQQKVEVGVVEVGLGGRHDATNILQEPLVSVITKIGEDHQALLGDTLEAIAYQKAGIMKKNAPCIADGSNSPSVVGVLRRCAEVTGASSFSLVDQHMQFCRGESVWTVLDSSKYELHQQLNIALAYEAFKITVARTRPALVAHTVLPIIADKQIPGRLQKLRISGWLDPARDLLLDGAHNAQSAEVLGNYVDYKLRGCKELRVTWVIAISHGKIIEQLLSRLLRTDDNLIATGFGCVEGMPWIISLKPEEIVESAIHLRDLRHCQTSNGSVKETISIAARVADGGPIVIAGSLYLVSDVLRAVRQ